MIFQETRLPGAFLIDPERRGDERGFFARVWCVEEALAQGISVDFVQSSISYNGEVGTLRGLCFQRSPFSEVKVVRCTRGVIQDVIVDLRPDSPTFQDHLSVELSAENRRMLLIPEGLAHGFLTLEPNTEVHYQISQFYAPSSEGGVRYDDPAFGIRWWRPVRIISERDANRPDFSWPEFAPDLAGFTVGPHAVSPQSRVG